MRKIAILFADRLSIYKGLPDVEVYCDVLLELANAP